MIVFTDLEGRIKDVNTTLDSSLIPKEINDEENPFNSWSVAKICCYKVTVKNGIVTMMTPYVDSRLLEHIDQMAKETEVNSANIDYIAMETGIDLDQEEDEPEPSPKPSPEPDPEEPEESIEDEAQTSAPLSGLEWDDVL